MKYMGDYIDVNRLHTVLSMEVLEMERKTQICIYNILRMLGNIGLRVIEQQWNSAKNWQQVLYVKVRHMSI